MPISGTRSVCPSPMAVRKEDCKAAGQIVGGLLHDGNIVEGFWTDRPSGCSFGPVITFNTNPNGRNNLVRNVALGKPTHQSSTLYGSISSNAVNGNKVSGGTHTDLDNNPWWSVDLEGMFEIVRIRVFRTGDCCWDRLKDFKLEIFSGENREWSYTHKGIPEYETVINLPYSFSGDKIQISLPEKTQYLTLTEVEVEARIRWHSICHKMKVR